MTKQLRQVTEEDKSALRDLFIQKYMEINPDTVYINPSFINRATFILAKAASEIIDTHKLQAFLSTAIYAICRDGLGGAVEPALNNMIDRISNEE